MTVIPIADLSQADIHFLGVNVVSAIRADREIDAVNRSLAAHGEQIEELADHRPAELMTAVAV